MNGDYLLHCILRWGHMFSAILWIGGLFCFALAVGPMIKRLEDGLKDRITLSFVSRGFYLIRVGSLSTIIFGLGVFWWSYMHKDNMWTLGENGAKTLSDRGRLIMYGMTFAMIMAGLLWLVVWPAQRKIFAAIREGRPVDPKYGKLTNLGCVLNLYLTGPTLMLMILTNHYSTFDIKAIGAGAAASLVLIHLFRVLIGKTAPAF